jgi:hypothetical protein
MKKVIKPNPLRKKGGKKVVVVLQKLNMNPYQLQSIVHAEYMLILSTVISNQQYLF